MQGVGFIRCDGCDKTATDLEIQTQDLREPVWLLGPSLHLCTTCVPKADETVWKLIADLKEKVEALTK